MLTEKQIQEALHADRVIPIPVPNAHGPLGLAHLLQAVGQMPDTPVEKHDKIRRLVELSPETWQKLDQLAEDAGKTAAKPVTASQVAALILEHFAAQSQPWS